MHEIASSLSSVFWIIFYPIVIFSIVYYNYIITKIKINHKIMNDFIKSQFSHKGCIGYDFIASKACDDLSDALWGVKRKSVDIKQKSE